MNRGSRQNSLTQIINTLLFKENGRLPKIQWQQQRSSNIEMERLRTSPQDAEGEEK